MVAFLKLIPSISDTHAIDETFVDLMLDETILLFFADNKMYRVFLITDIYLTKTKLNFEKKTFFLYYTYYKSQNFIIIASREIYVADRNGKTTFPPKSFLASSHKTQWGEKLKQSAIRLYVPQV